MSSCRRLPSLIAAPPYADGPIVATSAQYYPVRTFERHELDCLAKGEVYDLVDDLIVVKYERSHIEFTLISGESGCRTW
jgi:hypothetical protein